jgi:hypothetical protein
MMHDGGKSDTLIVPEKPPNNAGQPAAEAVEGRGVAKGSPLGNRTRRTQSRVPRVTCLRADTPAGDLRSIVSLPIVITRGKSRMR